MPELIPTFTDEIKTLLGERLMNLDSASLRLEKFTFLGDNSKLKQINAVCAKAATKKVEPSPLGSLLKNTQDRGSQFVLTLGGRMMIDHAGGILENAGLCLHRFFNYPMIPGSALKGIALHYAVDMWRKKAASAKEIVHIFGYPTNIEDFDVAFCPDANKRSGLSQAGNVSFLRAVPADTNWKLVADVLTPHGDTDYTSPIPSFFTAVEKGAKFNFTLLKLSKATDNALKRAEEFLHNALCEKGIGAKTVAGYGWFSGQSSSENTINLELVTPGFFGGADLNQVQDCDLRVPTLRGMLRWWWRILYREFLDEKTLFKLQSSIWGDTGQSSLISLRIENLGTPVVKRFNYKDGYNVKHDFARQHNLQARNGGLHYLAYGMNEKTGNEIRQRCYVEPGAQWKLHYSIRKHNEFSEDDIAEHFNAALSLLCQFGGVGSKSRNGFGSLFWEYAWNEDDCRDSAKEFCEKYKYPIRKDEPYYALNSKAIINDIAELPEDPWTALDKTGIAVKNFAAKNKHNDEKAVLGLPRKIHGPLPRPMRHQQGHRHQAPKTLTPDLQDAQTQNPGNARFAAPAWLHFSPLENGKLQLTITAFPSDMIRNYGVSKSILDEFTNDLIEELDR